MGLWGMGMFFFPLLPSYFLLFTFTFHFTFYSLLWSFISLLLVMACVCYFSLSFFDIIQFASRCTLFKGDEEGKDDDEVAESWMGRAHDLSHLASLSPLLLLIFPLFWD